MDRCKGFARRNAPERCAKRLVTPRNRVGNGENYLCIILTLQALPGASFWSGADGEEPSNGVVDYGRGDGEVPPQFGGRARLPKCVEGAQSVRIILAA